MHRMTERFKLPPVKVTGGEIQKKLPYNGNAVTEKSFSFSFACFDRTHDYFNMGDATADGVVSGKWFLDLLDCLKSISNQKIHDLKGSMYDLHPVDWHNANVAPPPNSEQLEYWQLRVNKSKGRIIGFKIDNIFYIVWLDPHHNLSDSEGYGTATKYRSPMSEYETNLAEIQYWKEQAEHSKADLEAAEELLKGD